MILTFTLFACAPETVDLSADDLFTLRDPPPTLIDDQGQYQGGWYNGPIETLNTEASTGPPGDFKRFLHVQFDDPDWFVVGNIADMGSASNVALLAVEKATGTFHDVSLSGLFADNRVEVNPAHTRFTDPTTHSTLTLEDGALTMDLHAEGLDLVGTASPAFDALFTQVTRFHPGHGSYQTWGIVSVDALTLTVDGQDIALAPGSFGAYDRTLGHQRRAQSWNWLATAGMATDVDTGDVVPFALQFGKDREDARPQVEGLKYPAWAGEDFGKVTEVDFDYTADPETRETGEWRITGPEVDLRFVPEHHRRERVGQIWIAETDFNQYYGTLSGTFTLAGRTWQVDEVFAVCEESLIRL